MGVKNKVMSTSADIVDIPGDAITEDEVIKPLRRFAAFADFYKARRPQIAAAGPVVWRVDRGIPAAGTCAEATLFNESGGKAQGWIITLRQWPRAKLDDARTVAHELAHAVLDIEGWPSAEVASGAPEEVRHLVSAVNSLLDRPVDLILVRYGFAPDPACSLSAIAHVLGGPRHQQVLAMLRQVDLTTPAAMAAQMRALAASKGNLFDVATRG